MLLRLFTGIIALGCAAPGFSLADHLLLSEVAVDTATETATASSEYAEVFNPTGATISLENYYLSDYNGADKYYSVTSFNAPWDTGSSDYVLRFPAGTSLDPGKVAVVTQDAVTFLGEFFGGDLNAFLTQPGNPQLFEVINSDPLVPDMVNFNNNGTNAETFSKTNGGEHIVLFHWDGASDLVQDVDLIQWGSPSSTNTFAQKTSSIVIDGPDADAIGTAYVDDAGPVSQFTVSTAPFALLVRVSSDETDEVAMGGNGITGNDETTEDVNTTWVGHAGMTNRSPGTTTLPSVGGNATPQVTNVFRSIEYPSSSSTIDIEIDTADADGTVVDADLLVDSGSGFATVTMSQVNTSTSFTATIGPFADQTTIRYYIEITDNGGASNVFPSNAPIGHHRFIVDDNPVTEDDLVINEIMYNCQGSDTYEFVELYNRRNTPIDLSGFGFGDNLTNISYRIPDSTILPANEYLVLTLDTAGFEVQYGVGAATHLLDWGTFNLNNTGGDFVNWIHVNAINFNGTNVRTDVVNYLEVAPWPTEPNGGGPSLELISPELDNSLPESWKASSAAAAPFGTPGAANSPVPTATSDWQMFE